MNPLLIALLIGLLFGVLLSFKIFSRPLERRRIISYEFPEGWAQNLYSKLPLSFEIGNQTRDRLFKDIQWALADKEFFALGDKELEGLDCVFICAPFLLFEANTQDQTLTGLKRFLVLDETYHAESLPKEDNHDFCVYYDRHSSRVQERSQNKLEVKTQKVLTQLFGNSLAESFNQEPLFQLYAQKYKRTELLNAVDTLVPILKNEFYLPEQVDEELLIWKLHEIFCYSPEDIRKALPKTYQGLMQYYKLL